MEDENNNVSYDSGIIPNKNQCFILGTRYQLINKSGIDDGDPKLVTNSAYIEVLSKKIVLDFPMQTKQTFENLSEYNKKILRHEIIHAFFYESGLYKYYEDEVLVEWLAIQFAKISKVFNHINADERNDSIDNY